MKTTAMSSPADRALAAGWTRIPDGAVAIPVRAPRRSSMGEQNLACVRPASGWWYRGAQRVIWKWLPGTTTLDDAERVACQIFDLLVSSGQEP